MKKLAALLLTASTVFACGGMTQIDPPSLQLQTGTADTPIESVVDELEETLVIC